MPYQESKSPKCNSALLNNTMCQHQATTSIRKMSYMGRDVDSFNLFYCEQRDKSLVPSFPGHCVVIFSTISLFSHCCTWLSFFPSVCCYWQCHSGHRASLNTLIGLHSLLCFTFNTGTSLQKAALLIGKHWTAGIKCNCCFTAHKPLADAFFWSTPHITNWILLCNDGICLWLISH